MEVAGDRALRDLYIHGTTLKHRRQSSILCDTSCAYVCGVSDWVPSMQEAVKFFDVRVLARKRFA